MSLSIRCGFAFLALFATGSTPAKPSSVCIESFRFASDHGLLPRDPGAAGPITHTAGEKVRAEVTLIVSGLDRSVPFELQGASAEPGLCFRSVGQLTEGKVALPLLAVNPLGPMVRKIDARINWLLILRPTDRPVERVSLGSTGPYVIYTTLGTPRNTDCPAGDVTERRMELVVSRVAAAQKAAGPGASAPRLVYELMKQNGEHYLPTRHYRGAQAWRLPESWTMQPPGGSCIAIAEFVKLLCDMTGLEGEVRLSAYCAWPSDAAAVRGGLGDPPQFKPGPNATTWQLFLIDHRNSRQGQVGGVGGVNYYEAVLEYDWHGKRYFYPGGTDRVFDDPALVLHVFHTLAWAEFDERHGDWVVREVVRTYVPAGGKFPSSVPLP
jgi:hypothetical protein